MQDLKPILCECTVACAWLDDPYLACLLLEREQLVDGSLWVALEHRISFTPAC